MKRATHRSVDCHSIPDISIHALVKRATGELESRVEGEWISIHALVKRATEPLYNTSEGDLHFNPRPREEGDFLRKPTERFCVNFNPRPREEGDALKSFDNFHSRYFNPRPREEGDS